MYEGIQSALHDFAAGKVTKGGFTQLEMMLARIRQEAGFDAARFDELLAQLTELAEAGDEDFAMGISLAAKKTGCYGARLREALERKLFANNDGLSARAQFELSNLLIKCGGEFAPQQLNKLVALKSEIPELWLDLALEAYPYDTQGLSDVIVSLIENNLNPLRWESLRPRYLKLVAAVPNNQFNAFSLRLAKSLSAKEGREFLDWINERRGTGLSLSRNKTRLKASQRSIVDDSALDFITQNSLFAEAAA